jgi:hypothetical protein
VALEAELEELVALTPGVVHWSVKLRDTVGDADYAGGLVCSAGEGPFVASCCWVRIDCVDAWAVACDAIGGVGTVRTIEGIKEGVETSVREGFDKIVDLIQGDGLWLPTC